MATFPTLRGRVVDAEGKPAARIEVQAAGVLRDTAVTDADGAFVFPKLQPGLYTLVARPNPPLRQQVAPPQEERVEPVQTYYPSLIESAQAESIQVRGGEDLSGYEIRMRTAPVQRIRGTVFSLSGKPAAKALVTLMIPPSPPPFVMRGATVLKSQPAVSVEQVVATGADGSFEFASVRRGDWQIRVQTAPEPDAQRQIGIPHFGSTPVSVGRRDIDDLTIRLAEPFALNVTTDWEQGNPRANLRAMLELIPLDGQMSGAVIIGQTQGVQAYQGRSILWAPVSVPGHYPAAIMLGGRDVQGQAVNITAPQPVQVVYKSDGGTVRGTVDKGADMIVVLIPQETGSLKIGISGKAGPGGAFSIADVPPGDYFAAAVPDTNGIATAEFQRFLAANGTRVRVEPSLAVSVDLRPARWP